MEDVNLSAAGLSMEAANQAWDELVSGADPVVAQLAQQCQGVALFLRDAADKSEYTQLLICCQVLLTVLQLALAQALAPLTLGVSAALSPGLVALGRLRVVQHASMAELPDAMVQSFRILTGRQVGFDTDQPKNLAVTGWMGGLVGT